ncbi:MAG: CocE/NonD family hydrolase, partial [Bdellovibrionales bacterium]|nr:CocE/NonD family hydrolase [Bdellovibrionales bacterium]
EWFAMVQEEIAQEAIAPVRYYTTGLNAWRESQEWPPPGLSPTTMYLAPSGEGRGAGHLLWRQQPPPMDAVSYQYDPANPTPSLGGVSLGHGAGMERQNDLYLRADLLVFTSAPLNEAIEISGAPEVTLTVGSTSCSTDFFVKLVDIFPGGDGFNISEGVVRVADCSRRQKGLAKKTITLPLQPLSRVLFAGHRLQMIITSSHFPRFERNERQADVTVHFTATEPSTITFPMRKQSAL